MSHTYSRPLSTPKCRRGSRAAAIWLCGALALLGACTSLDQPAAPLSAPLLEDSAEIDSLSASLRDATGGVVGRADFSAQGDAVVVGVYAYLAGAGASIRGMHIHANDNPANGTGCIADPTQPATTHFVSVDGHFSPNAASHGRHAGDLPALTFTHGAEAAIRFMTDAFTLDEIAGRALIIHAGPDNYGNIPVGDQPNQYKPNDAAANDLTGRTGNAGARVACGVIE